MVGNYSQQSAENSGSSTSSGGSSNYGTLGRVQGGGMASMMDEMAKTLARRRAAVEKKDTESAPVRIPIVHRSNKLNDNNDDIG